MRGNDGGVGLKKEHPGNEGERDGVRKIGEE